MFLTKNKPINEFNLHCIVFLIMMWTILGIFYVLHKFIQGNIGIQAFSLIRNFLIMLRFYILGKFIYFKLVIILGKYFLFSA